MESTHITIEKKSGIIALAGAPNAGKSTLLNHLLGTPLAIVSPKAQTTRRPVTGIMVHGESQLAFTDTPGLFQRPNGPLQQAMLNAAKRVIGEADVVVFMVDATKVKEPGQLTEQLKTLLQHRSSVVVALNKTDLITKDAQLPLLQELNAHEQVSEVVPISATKGHNVDALLDVLAAKVPEGEWLFEEDQWTDTPARVLAEEITREKLLQLLHEEVPHNLSVATESWEQKKNGLHLRQQITVARGSHKKIVVGNQGQTLKKVGSSARQSIGQLLDQKCHLFLHVRVRDKWEEEEARRII